MEASTINQPHPDDQAGDEAEEFFGDSEEIQAGLPLLTPEQQEAEAARYREEHGEPHPKASDPSPRAESAGPTDEPEPESAEPDAPAEAEAAAQRGAVEREYIVFHKVPLSERVLRRMLDEIEAGRAPEPRVAYVELERPVARNDKQAVGQAYRKHREDLGARCALVAVSARSFKERRVEPDAQPAEPKLKIV